MELDGAWIGTVRRYEGRWVASVPAEPWNVEVGTADTRTGAVRLLKAWGLGADGG